MVSIRNIEKFFDDHPELWEKKYKILGMADKRKDRWNIISGGALKEIFGSDEDLFNLFCAEIIREDHIRIGLEDVGKEK